MALKSSREGLRKELVDYLGNLIVDDYLRNEIVKAIGDKFVTPELLNENVNNLTMQITTESGERIEVDDILQNNITTEVTAREEADTTLQNNINVETTAREEAITSLQELIANGTLKMDLLWTNASPESEFAPQTISLDLSSYKSLLIRFDIGVTDSSSIYYKSHVYNVFLKSGNRAYSSCVNYYNIVNSQNIYREIYSIDDNGVSFGNGKISSIDGGYNNTAMIPTEIYGMR